MFKRICIVTICIIISLFGLALAEENADEPSLETIFQNMEVEELKEAETLLQDILNAKILAGATLQLPETDIQLAAQKTYKLSLSCDGREIDSKTKITYESSDTTIATVSPVGLVTGKGSGTAAITITATFPDGGVLTTKCQVNVFVPVAAITATPTTATVLSGYTVDLKPLIKISPMNATEDKLIFSSEDETIATVDENGIVTGVNGGKVKITITSAEKTDKPKTTFINMTVNQPVSSIKIDQSTFKVGKGAKQNLTYTVQPETATSQLVTWTSSDPKIASVTANGTVTGIKSGTATITCTAKDGSGISASANIEVITAVSSITISPKTIAIYEGSKTTLSRDVKPVDATEKTLKWSSSNINIVSVNSNGQIEAKRVGEATITAQTTDGSNKSASVKVYVEPKNPVMVTSIHWQTTWGMKNGKIGIYAENLCTSKTIKSFDYTLECYNRYDSRPVVSYMSYSGETIQPGKERKGKLSNESISGFNSAYYINITPTFVYFTDGTTYSIPKTAQYTSSFDMR